MMLIDLPQGFTEVNPEELDLEKSLDFYKTLLKTDYSNFKSSHKDDLGNEIVVYSTEPEIDQNPKIDIRYQEELYVIFPKRDEIIPLVFSRRPDFPEVSHLNAMATEYPRCLCIYEEPYESLKHSWTSFTFIERIRQWLSLTSRDELHQDDQPLEPFLMNNQGRLILPADYDESKELFLEVKNQYKERVTILGSHQAIGKTSFLLFNYKLKPIVHNVVRYSPENLHELSVLLKDTGTDFIREVLKPWLRECLDLKSKSNFRSRLVLLLSIPKLRNEKDDNPIIERIAFVFLNGLIDICKEINLVAEAGGELGFVLFSQKYDLERVKSIGVAPLSVYAGLTPKKASLYNGIFDDTRIEQTIGMIGCGALGSQLFMNLVRSGYYKWKLIDHDVLLPHNLARHSLNSSSLGESKAESIGSMASALLNVATITSLQENYLKTNKQDELNKLISSSDLILDVSASVPVARKLSSDEEVQSRVVSVFMNPKGTDLVVLAEPTDRSIRLTELEARYYKLIIENEKLHRHIVEENANIRYSASCRDLSAILEQDNFSILSGIASKFLKQIQAQRGSGISIWQVLTNGEIQTTQIKGERYISIHQNDWNFKIAESVIRNLEKSRLNKLPKETGGILLGFIDFKDSTTYVIETINSPEDSQEYPAAYYRGIDGVKKKLENIYQWTHGHINYLGEWHSHPKGHSLNMSDDDKILFKWIKEHMSPLGYPPLMIIAGDGSNFKVHNRVT